MEIFIVGIIIVGLMVYVSTRIKKASQLAYARETFETAEFRITKPDEFIIPADENSPYLFEARSRDFGSEDVRDFYQCQATVKSAENHAEESVFETRSVEKKAAINSFHKIISDSEKNKSYELKISVLPEFKEKYQTAIDEMLNSFRVK